MSFISSKSDCGFLRNSNQGRKVVLLQNNELYIGLVQHSCAVFLKQAGSSWIGKIEEIIHPNQLSGLGIILVDPPIKDEYRLSGETSNKSCSLPSEPFLGGPEDFNVSETRNSTKLGKGTLRYRGMLEELVYRWTSKKLTIFDPSQPTLQALSYYPLKIVAVEWISYISVMGFALKNYEASDISNDLQVELDKLSLSIRVLQAWRRRILASMENIRQVIYYIKLHENFDSCSEEWDGLREDYDFISTGFQEYANRLESMIPVATSFIQLVESRRAILETSNVTRLTVLAIIFIPLSFVATIFSMNDKYGPGGPKFWVHFAVALPTTMLVLFVARTLGSNWGSLRWPSRLRFEIVKPLPI